MSNTKLPALPASTHCIPYPSVEDIVFTPDQMRSYALEAIAADRERQAGEAVAFEGFLCRAWGETDLTAAQIATDWTGVCKFAVREWLGDENDTHWDGTNTLDQLKADFDEHENDGCGGPLVYTFEIGGFSVERVFAHAVIAAAPSPDGKAEQAEAPSEPDMASPDYRAGWNDGVDMMTKAMWRATQSTVTEEEKK